jgi:hypothetical protein
VEAGGWRADAGRAGWCGISHGRSETAQA